VRRSVRKELEERNHDGFMIASMDPGGRHAMMLPERLGAWRESGYGQNSVDLQFYDFLLGFADASLRMMSGNPKGEAKFSGNDILKAYSSSQTLLAGETMELFFGLDGSVQLLFNRIVAGPSNKGPTFLDESWQNTTIIATRNITIEWSNKPIFDIKGKRVPGMTDVIISSNYDINRKTVNFEFIQIYDNVMNSGQWSQINGNDYYQAVFAHENAHVQQFMDMVNDSNFSYKNQTGTFGDILFNSGLSGEQLDLLFIDMFDYARIKWQNQNNNDPNHSDANRRAKQNLPKHLRKYLRIKPVF
ncbi:MAG: hypothetical protein WBG62_19465, partial [Cyclobacteriaceae bacterium]